MNNNEVHAETDSMIRLTLYQITAYVPSWLPSCAMDPICTEDKKGVLAWTHAGW